MGQALALLRRHTSAATAIPAANESREYDGNDAGRLPHRDRLANGSPDDDRDEEQQRTDG